MTEYVTLKCHRCAREDTFWLGDDPEFIDNLISILCPKCGAEMRNPHFDKLRKKSEPIDIVQKVAQDFWNS